MALTSHQSEKLEEGLDILLPEGKLKKGARLLIKGSAGVGKTFLVETLISMLLPHCFGSIYCSAPTNKAVGVLQSKIKLKDKRIKFLTVDKALQIKMRIDEKTRSKVFQPSISEKYPPLKGVSVWIIDEASMVGWEKQKWIEECSNKQNVIVIFLGDDKQINPVLEEDSPVFYGKPVFFDNADDCAVYSVTVDDYTLVKQKDKFICYEPYPSIELTEIVRQGPGNPIIALSRNTPAIYNYETKVNKETGCGFVYTSNLDKIIEELALVNGTDDLKYLAWSNNDVDSVNVKVRNKIYGNPAKIELEETMVFDEPYQDTYYTNQEIKVSKLNIDTLSFGVIFQNSQVAPDHEIVMKELKVYIINGFQVDEWGDGNMIWKGVFVVHEDSEEEYKSIITQLNASLKYGLILYRDKVCFENIFAKLKYNHALTVHKSQGSTFRRTILNVRNVTANQNEKEKARLLYTGITRASELLILYNA